MAFDTPERAATWADNISWDGETWEASGIEVRNLTSKGVTLEFPLADWKALIRADGTGGRSISIYEHYTDITASPQTADAVLMFSGVMDAAAWTDKIVVSAVEKSRVTSFPPESVEAPKFTYLLKSGQRIMWVGDTVVVR
ncbi:unnamed protein product [marine sediment metagenome]|uniref:Uncharacterized protein n=1 Tax=marine sediment metagenome TaxID=412755 RepID=X0WYC9_9ZZZZ